MKKLITCLMGAFLLFGCSSNSTEKVVTVASKPHSEGYLLADMITLMIENHSDITVKQTLGIAGGTSNIQPAMEKGEIDIYPEYSGTGWLFVLNNEMMDDPFAMYEELKKQYVSKYNIYWFEPYGFNNTFGIAVEPTIASEQKLETISDLAKVSSNYIFGAEYDFFERPDGYDGLVATYNLNFKGTKDMDIGLKYQAIAQDQVQVIDVFTTDGLLNEYKLKVLKDDLNFFPSYLAATLIRQETLDQYPELKTILAKLEGQISEDEMIEMNYEVEAQGKEAMDVAKAFLIKKGLINE